MQHRSVFLLLSILLQSCSASHTCSTGADYVLRLVGGQVPNEGRVEICVNQQWGTVCDDSWGDSDARVVCRQLGYPPENANSFRRAHFGQGSGEIFLDNVVCSGTESQLIYCSHPSVGVHDCYHYQDAGVHCVICSNGDIRLVGGLSEFEGRVEVCWNEIWGTVCDDSWGVTDARVVCRQLGYGTANIRAFGSARFGQGSGSIFLDDVGCSGSEQRLVSCSHRGIGNEDCGHHQDAGVRCGQCIENSVRLVGGSSQYEGRVEICLSGRWGTVCDDLWGDADARVVCRQRGHQGPQALSHATFGQGTAPIIMNNVRCSGTESQLARCSYDGAPVQGCSHSEDASVRCQNVPGSPETVSVTSLNPSSLTVSWTPPPANQQFGPLLRYNVSCSAPGTSHLYQTPDNTAFSRLVNGLHGCISYNCCVSAINAVGDGIKKCRSASTREDMPSAPPQSVAAYATSPTSLFISWSAPLLEHRNGCIRQYRIYVVERDTGTTLTRLINTFQVTISSLHPYYQYECKAAAITTGEGPSSQTVTTRTYSSLPSGRPRNIIVSQTSRSVSLEWDLPLPADRNGVITSYFIRVTDIQTSVISDYTTAATSYTVESLRPRTPYSIMIAARNVNGTGPFSWMREVQTAEDAPSSPPQGIEVSSFSSNFVNLSWSSPRPEHRNGIITGYVINVTLEDTGASYQLTSQTTQLTVESLVPNGLYAFAVAAQTSVGTGPFSMTIMQRTDRKHTSEVLTPAIASTFGGILVVVITVSVAVLLYKKQRSKTMLHSEGDVKNQSTAVDSLQLHAKENPSIPVAATFIADGSTLLAADTNPDDLSATQESDHSCIKAEPASPDAPIALTGFTLSIDPHLHKVLEQMTAPQETEDRLTTELPPPVPKRTQNYNKTVNDSMKHRLLRSFCRDRWHRKKPKKEDPAATPQTVTFAVDQHIHSALQQIAAIQNRTDKEGTDTCVHGKEPPQSAPRRKSVDQYVMPTAVQDGNQSNQMSNVDSESHYQPLLPHRLYTQPQENTAVQDGNQSKQMSNVDSESHYQPLLPRRLYTQPQENTDYHLHSVLQQIAATQNRTDKEGTDTGVHGEALPPSAPRRKPTDQSAMPTAVQDSNQNKQMSKVDSESHYQPLLPRRLYTQSQENTDYQTIIRE